MECVQCEKYIKDIKPEPIVMCGDCIKTHLPKNFPTDNSVNKTYDFTVENSKYRVCITLVSKL